MEQTQADLDFAELSEQLADFTADLVSVSQYEPFLQELFTKEAGAWVDVIALYKALEYPMRTIRPVQAALDGSLFVAWLNHPEASGDEGYCTVLFFAPESVWSNAMVYHKQRLMDKRSQQHNGAGV